MEVNGTDQVPCPWLSAYEALSVCFGMLHVHFQKPLTVPLKVFASLHLLGKGWVLRGALLVFREGGGRHSAQPLVLGHLSWGEPCTCSRTSPALPPRVPAGAETHHTPRPVECVPR